MTTKLRSCPARLDIGAQTGIVIARATEVHIAHAIDIDITSGPDLDLEVVQPHERPRKSAAPRT